MTGGGIGIWELPSMHCFVLCVMLSLQRDGARNALFCPADSTL